MRNWKKFTCTFEKVDSEAPMIREEESQRNYKLSLNTD